MFCNFCTRSCGNKRFCDNICSEGFSKEQHSKKTNIPPDLLKKLLKIYGELKTFSQRFQGLDRTREITRIRDGHTCQECGLKRTPAMIAKYKYRSLDVHHLNGICGKKSRSYDKVSEMGGLITLCHKCHYNRHDFSMNSQN